MERVLTKIKDGKSESWAGLQLIHIDCQLSIVNIYIWPQCVDQDDHKVLTKMMERLLTKIKDGKSVDQDKRWKEWELRSATDSRPGFLCYCDCTEQPALFWKLLQCNDLQFFIEDIQKVKNSRINKKNVNKNIQIKSASTSNVTAATALNRPSSSQKVLHNEDLQYFGMFQSF